MIEEEYAAFFSRHYDSLRAYVRRRVAPDDVDEVTAEVFVQAWQRWPESGERALPWLYRAASLIIQNHRRALEHRSRVQRDVFDLSRDALLAGRDDAAAEVAAKAAAFEALTQLGEQDREVLLLSCWEGLSATEIGRVLGCSAPAAHVRLHRARRRLIALMGKSHDPDKQETSAIDTAATTNRRR